MRRIWRNVVSPLVSLVVIMLGKRIFQHIYQLAYCD